MKPKDRCAQCDGRKNSPQHVGDTWEHDFETSREGFGSKRRPLNPVSEPMAEKRAARVDPRDAQLREYPYCEATRDGAPKACSDDLCVHEPWTRARGGPINDRANMRTTCALHNVAISQDLSTMRWAKEHEYLVPAEYGPEWLAAGGVWQRRAVSA